MSEANKDDNRTIVLTDAELPPANASSPLAAAPTPQHNALQIGTRLGEFEIVGLVGEGGFGIVYLAQDHSLQRKVALKEYMPSSLATRGLDASVSVRSERYRETFEIGRRSFVNEARLLAQFDHPALVKVYRFWEANGTAYMAMPFYEGKTLGRVMHERGKAADEIWIKTILAPVIESLELIHTANCYHRDIAPDNIMLQRDERPVLLDFGAARRVIGDMTQALTVILKPGYAPIEQYAEMPGMRQGPWTDVYALAAVVYFCIIGRTPPPSVSRMVKDTYEPLAQAAAGRYSGTFLRGVDECLNVRAEDRPQSMSEMRDLLGMGLRSRLHPAPNPTITLTPANVSQGAKAQQVTPAVASPPNNIQVEKPVLAKDGQSVGARGKRLRILGAAGVALAAVGAVFILQTTHAPPAPVSSAAEPAPVPQDQAGKPAMQEKTAPDAQVTASSLANSSLASSSLASSSPPSSSPSSSLPTVTETPAREPRKVTTPKAAAAKELTRPTKPAKHNSPEEEREYLRKLNKDLEGLVRP